MKLDFRHNEGVLIVKQNNEEHSLTLLGMNRNVQQFLGYEQSLEEVPFTDILGDKTREAVEEDVEFEHDAKDMLEVLKMHRMLRLKRKDGSETSMAFTIMRSMAQGRHHMFRLIVKPQYSHDEMRAATDALKESFKGHEVLDQSTGLPDHDSMLKNIELTQNFLSRHEITSAFVYVKVVQPDIQTDGDKLTAHVGHILQRNLRGDDVIGRMDQDGLGIILIDVNPQTLHMALNRLKQMTLSDEVPLEQGQPLHITIRQSATLIETQEPDALLSQCMNALDDYPQEDMIVLESGDTAIPHQHQG